MIKREKTRGGSDESKERKVRVGREGKGREGKECEEKIDIEKERQERTVAVKGT